MKRTRLRRLLTVTAVALALLAVSTLVSTSGCASFGAAPIAHPDSPEYGNGKFVNVEPTTMMAKGGGAALHEWLTSNTLRAPTCTLPLAKPSLSAPPETGLRITWLGHSTTLIEIDGATILTDPMWGDRASPSAWVGPKRFHPPPLPLAELPKLDAVIISHDHYDHLDMGTVKTLAATGVIFHVGLGVGRHLEAWGVPKAQIIEHDWHSRTSLANGTHIISTPARHFSGRRGIGNDGTLWTSWSIIGPKHRVYFSGDTGLTHAFADIGAKYGPFDVAMLEIGQWHPSWGDIHLGPRGALEAFALLHAQKLLPIHWSTFELGLHAWSEPAETLTLEAAQREVTLLTPMLGESIEPATAKTTAWWRAYPPMTAECPK